MVTRVEAGVQDHGLAPGCAGGDPRDPALLAAALVASLERALLDARCLLDALDHASGDDAASAGLAASCAPVGGLSRRETEVLRLLAAGRSNRRIAAALHLSPRTVQRHVANVYLKLGAHCRAEATAYALRHGLA